MASLLPWGDIGLTFTSDVARTWTVLDDWIVAEVEGRQCLEEVVQTVKQMDSITIYNDKHLWLAFKFLFKHKNEALIEIAPELEKTEASCLRSNSFQYFKKDLPYIPNPASPFSFDDSCVCAVDVVDINW